LADDLRLFLAHQPTMARPPSLASGTAKWMNRHRSFVASAVNDGGLAPRDECRQSIARSPSRRGECSLRAWKGECLSRAKKPLLADEQWLCDYFEHCRRLKATNTRP
jgi:hypothetical protein